jgi:hypothetical protein
MEDVMKTQTQMMEQSLADEIIESVIHGVAPSDEAAELLDILHIEGWDGHEELPAVGENKAREIAKQRIAERQAWLKQQKMEGLR